MQKQTIFVIALAVAASVTSQACAGLSGTSDRVQQISNSQAAATPQAHPQAKPQAAPKTGAGAPAQAGGNFDGTWSVSSSPGCGLLARSSVEIRRGRISGQGLVGSIDATGNVRTVARGSGRSVVSKGQASGATASGTYHVSNGCTGTWTARKA